MPKLPKILVLFLTAIALTTPTRAHPGEPLRDGDIVFQQSRSSQSAAIAAATGSRYTHMGMITLRDGKPFVLEAVQPVKLTPLSTWAARGADKHVIVKRLSEPLSAATIEKMRAAAQPLVGKSYDTAFAWDDERMYCSELVYKIYERGAGITIGSLQKLGDFDLTSAAVRKKLRERYGDKVPLDATVISPQSMFDDPKLMTVQAE